jgi:flagellar assembly protein FliH
MMISPSRSADANWVERRDQDRTPLRLWRESDRVVSRLEFYPPGAGEIEDQVPVDQFEEPLKEEVAAPDERLRAEEEQMSAELEMARSEAKVEARREWEKELEDNIAKERFAIVEACEGFYKDRVRYFAQVEAEVVKLALAIAARVLHREVTFDPLLLSGVVRVALEQVVEKSGTVLRVSADAIEQWCEFFAAGSEFSPQIVGDERLAAGECVLETNVGRVELGVSAQLKEIESGFFDLIKQRPA